MTEDSWAANVSFFHILQLRKLSAIIALAEKDHAGDGELDAVRQAAAKMIKDGFGGDTFRRLRNAAREDLTPCREEIDALVERVNSYIRSRTNDSETRSKVDEIGRAASAAIQSYEQMFKPAFIGPFVLPRQFALKDDRGDVEDDNPKFVFRADGKKLWELTYEGVTRRVNKLVGMKYLAELLSRPGATIAATELERVNSLPGAPPRSDARSGDNRFELDELHKQVRQLLSDKQKAEASGETVFASELADDIESLMGEIKRMSGRGGRPRVDSAAGRAKRSVAKAIDRAIKEIAKEHPELGQHLKNCVSTRTDMSYNPDRKIDWRV